MTFGQRITQLRKDKKWSQEELGGKVGTSAPIIGRYERGEITPSIEVGKKIADALGVTVDYLIEGGELLDKATLTRMKELQQLPEKDREHIFYTLDNLIKAAKFKAIQ